MEPRPRDRSCSWPLSSRTDVARDRGLLAALAELGRHGPPAILLEACAQPTPTAAVGQRLALAGVPVLGLVGAGEGHANEGLDSPVEARADRALGRAAREAATILAWGSNVLVVPLTGELAGGALLRRSLAGLTLSERAAKLDARAASAAAERESTAERLARRLFALARSSPQSRWVLLPSADPAAAVDPTTLIYVLEDLPALSLGVALDLGAIGLRSAWGGPSLETWLTAAGSSLEMILISDHDGQARSDLGVGLGITRWAEYRTLLPRSRPWVVRPDPTVPFDLQRDGLDPLEEALGRPPEESGSR